MEYWGTNDVLSARLPFMRCGQPVAFLLSDIQLD